MRYVHSALLATLLAACQTTPAPEASRADVEQALQDWAAAFNSCDAEKLSSLYAPDAVLWGTVAPVIISSPPGLRQYFERACSPNPQPKVAVGEHLVRVYGNSALNSGSYTFTVFPGGQARQFPARYSFAYQRQGDRWLIVDHHSSALPSPPAPPASAANK